MLKCRRGELHFGEQGARLLNEGLRPPALLEPSLEMGIKCAVWVGMSE